jgi:hypothetical protein
MRTRLLLAAIAALVTPLAASAHAVTLPDEFSLAGLGTVTNPGLPCDDSCDVHVDFTLVLAPESTPITACTFDGVTGPDTLLIGSGNGSLFCDDGSNGPVHFDRYGSHVQISSNPTLQVHGCRRMVGALTFIPTSANPTTSFIVSGGGVLVPC